MKLAIIDTSSILFGFSNRKNVFEAASDLRGYSLLVVAAVIRELRWRARNKGALGAAARTALLELRYKNIKVASKAAGDADAEILRAARKHKGSAVITNDTELSKRLRGMADVFRLNLDGRLVRTR